MGNQNNLKYILILIPLLFFLFLIPYSSAAYQQNRCVNIKVIITNATNINISTISLPDSTIAEVNKTMLPSGKSFIYSFCNTSQIGTYNYDYTDQSGTAYAGSFEISASGTSGGILGNFGFYFLMFAFGYVILFVGIFTKNVPVTILGGFATILAGLYTLNNGIDIYRNFATEGISLITIMFGGFWAVKASIESLEDYNHLS